MVKKVLEKVEAILDGATREAQGQKDVRWRAATYSAALGKAKRAIEAERVRLSGRDLPNRLSISSYLHCGKCLAELPSGQSPQSYAALSVGWTEAGLQVWCHRHEANVLHVDFEDHPHPANMTCAAVPAEGETNG